MKTQTAAISLLLASALLTACSAQDDNAVNASATPAESSDTAADVVSSSAGDEQLETGEYRTEPHKGWPRDNDKIGSIIETNRIAFNTLLPYEVDPAFSVGGVSDRDSSIDTFQFAVPPKVSEALNEVGSKYLTGFHTMATTEKEDRKVENYVARFTDPESAQRAADLIHSSLLAQSGGDRSVGEPGPLEEIAVPGQNTARATIDTPRAMAYAVDTHNEFLIYSVALNLSSTDREIAEMAPGEVHGANQSLDPETDPSSLDWAPEYFSTFLAKQHPLIDTIPTHITEAGYGQSAEWPDADPDNLLKFSVLKPDSYKQTGPVPAATNERMMVGNYRNVPEMFTLYQQANIEAASQGETMLFRTKNPESAQLIRATYASMDDASDPQPYDDPQGVPGTECYVSHTAHGKNYSCTLVYENYFAEGSEDEIDSTSPDVGGSTSTQEAQVDHKARLSRKMAAQYLLLKQAPVQR